MAVQTHNIFGKISITDEAIASIAAHTALDCYGVIDLVSKGLGASLKELSNRKKLSKGVKVFTYENRISLDLFVILKYGVSISAVADSLKKSVKYSVEQFTGMIVEAVNINIVGVRL